MRSQRGAATSTLVAALIPALIVLTGLVVDSAQNVRLQRHLQTSAAAAARAGADQLAHIRLAGGSDTRGAVRAARTHLKADDLTGQVRVQGGELQVTVSSSSPTVFLGIIGIDVLEANATASASLVADG